MPQTEQTFDLLHIAHASLTHRINNDAYAANPSLWHQNWNFINYLIQQDKIFHILDTDRVNASLQDVLQPGLMNDPYALPPKDLPLIIKGQTLLVKAEPAMVMSAADAININWQMGVDEEKIAAAYAWNKTAFPERSALLLKHLSNLPSDLALDSLGIIQSYRLITDKDGKTGIDITEPTPVVAVSNPKTKNERSGMRPVVELFVEGHPTITTLQAGLVSRDGMSNRIMMSGTDMIANGVYPTVAGQNIAIIDYNKVDAQDLNYNLKKLAL